MIKKIVIATHSFSPGTSQALWDYCVRKEMDILFIEHLLFRPPPAWLLDAVDTFIKVVKMRKKYDLYIGSNRLNAFIGIILRKLNRVDKVIYFSPDWSEKRFNNRLLNYIFQTLDFFCVKHADLVWNSSAIMRVDPFMRARKKMGYPKEWEKKQIQVPDGTDEYPLLPFEKINRYEVGFVGHLREGMGLELLIDAFPEIAKRIPKAKLLIIGSGPLEKELQTKAKGLNIEFAGFIGDIFQVYQRLAKCALAVAPYEEGSISQYSDPGKVKNYLSVGLPIVITQVPKIALEIEKQKCGIAVDYDKNQLVEAIITLLNDSKLLLTYRKNTQKLVKKYSWERIFTRALKLTERKCMKKKVVIATHVFTFGQSQALRDYLKDKTEVLFIGHPILGNLFTWGVGAIDTLWQVLKTGKIYDLYFGSNNLNAFTGIILKKLGRVKKVIFYNPDSPPDRFKNKLLNYFYHWLDLYCVKNSDVVWNNSNRMMVEREKRGLSPEYRSKQIEVPNGTHLLPQKPFSKIDRFKVGFSGHLKEGTGVELLIEAFSKLSQKFSKAKLLIIGTGPLEKKLKQRSRKLNVEYAGFIGDIFKVYERLSECAFGVAPYEPGLYMQYTDPNKVKNYFSAGLPVIITDVPEIAREIKKKKCGIMIDYDCNELATAMMRLLTDDNLLIVYRKNVPKLARKYHYDKLFSKALETLEWQA